MFKRKGIDSNPNILEAILSEKLNISDKIISSNFKEKMNYLKTLSISLKINGYLINSKRQIENPRG